MFFPGGATKRPCPIPVATRSTGSIQGGIFHPLHDASARVAGIAEYLLYEETGPRFYFQVQFAQILTDDAERQQLNSAEEIHRQNDGCPTRDRSMRNDGSPKSPGGYAHCPCEYGEAEKTDQPQRK